VRGLLQLSKDTASTWESQTAIVLLLLPSLLLLLRHATVVL
jgi:hypothetical protein